MSNEILEKYQDTLLSSRKSREDDSGSNSDKEEWDDQDFLDLLDDTDSSAYRAQRMQELSQMMAASNSNVERASVRTLNSEAELFEMTTTTAQNSGLLKAKRSQMPNIVVHFFDERFETCKLMDLRLSELAERHFNTTTFVRIAAKDAPFLTVKLDIHVLPCVIAYVNGKETKRLLGFAELGNVPTKLDRGVLEAVLLKSGVLSRISLPSAKQVSFGDKQGSRIRGSRVTNHDDEDDDWN